MVHQALGYSKCLVKGLRHIISPYALQGRLVPHSTDEKTEVKPLAQSRAASQQLEQREPRLPEAPGFQDSLSSSHFPASAPPPHPTPARGTRPAPEERAWAANRPRPPPPFHSLEMPWQV